MIVKKKNFFELKSDNDQYNKEEGILKNNNLPFIPQKLFSNVFDLKEDSFIFEKTFFLDHSIYLEIETPPQKKIIFVAFFIPNLSKIKNFIINEVYKS